ncbi:nesprin-1-like isoform X2 [Anneissia japonica]|uniref:nesprin-1-like isoform X2 n=1 Tax=Anneissia japonica TaxID=1529436 RepID=UPI00142551CB|nr:nesprin-1-like isoform X2 [Anneissia japonica]
MTETASLMNGVMDDTSQEILSNKLARLQERYESVATEANEKVQKLQSVIKQRQAFESQIAKCESMLDDLTKLTEEFKEPFSHTVEFVQDKLQKCLNVRAKLTASQPPVEALRHRSDFMYKAGQVDYTHKVSNVNHVYSELVNMTDHYKKNLEDAVTTREDSQKFISELQFCLEHCYSDMVELDQPGIVAEQKLEKCMSLLSELTSKEPVLENLEAKAAQIIKQGDESDRKAMESIIGRLTANITDTKNNLQQRADSLADAINRKDTLDMDIKAALRRMMDTAVGLTKEEPMALAVDAAEETLKKFKGKLPGLEEELAKATDLVADVKKSYSDFSEPMPPQLVHKLDQIGNLNSKVAQALNAKLKKQEDGVECRRVFQDELKQLKDWLVEAEKALNEAKKGANFSDLGSQIHDHEEFFKKEPDIQDMMDDVVELAARISSSLPNEDNINMKDELKNVNIRLNDVSDTAGTVSEQLNGCQNDWDKFCNQIQDIESELLAIGERAVYINPATEEIAKENQLLNKELCDQIEAVDVCLQDLKKMADNLEKDANDDGCQAIHDSIEPLVTHFNTVKDEQEERRLNLKAIADKWKKYNDCLKEANEVIDNATNYMPEELTFGVPTEELIQQLQNSKAANMKLEEGRPLMENLQEAAQQLCEQVQDLECIQPVEKACKAAEQTSQRMLDATQKQMAELQTALEDRHSYEEEIDACDHALDELESLLHSIDLPCSYTVEDAQMQLSQHQDLKDRIGAYEPVIDILKQKQAAMHEKGQIDHAEDVEKLEALHNTLLDKLEDKCTQLEEAVAVREKFHDGIEKLKNFVKKSENEVEGWEEPGTIAEEKLDSCNALVTELQCKEDLIAELNSLRGEIAELGEPEDTQALDKLMSKVTDDISKLEDILRKDKDEFVAGVQKKDELGKVIEEMTEWMEETVANFQRDVPIGMTAASAGVSLEQHKSKQPEIQEQIKIAKQLVIDTRQKYEELREPVPPALDEKLNQISSDCTRLISAVEQKGEMYEKALSLREEFEEILESLEEQLERGERVLSSEIEGINFSNIDAQIQDHKDAFDDETSYLEKIETLDELAENISPSLQPDEYISLKEKMTTLNQRLSEDLALARENDRTLEESRGAWQDFVSNTDEVQAALATLEQRANYAVPNSLQVAQENVLLNKSIEKEVWLQSMAMRQLENQCQALMQLGSDPGQATVETKIQPIKDQLEMLKSDCATETPQLQDVVDKWQDYQDALQDVNDVIIDSVQFVPVSVPLNLPTEDINQQLNNAQVASEILAEGENKLLKLQEATKALVECIGDEDISEPTTKDLENISEKYQRVSDAAKEQVERLADAIQERADYETQIDACKNDLCNLEKLHENLNKPIGFNITDAEESLRECRDLQSQLALQLPLLEQLKEKKDEMTSKGQIDHAEKVQEQIDLLDSLIKTCDQKCEKLEGALADRMAFHEDLLSVQGQMHHCQSELKEMQEAGASPEDQLNKSQEFKEILKELQPKIEQLEANGQLLAIEGISRDQSMLSATMKTLKEDLDVTLQDLEQEEANIKDKVLEKEKLTAEVGDMLAWLEGIKDTMLAEDPIGIDVQQAEELLQIHQSEIPDVENMLQRAQAIIITTHTKFARLGDQVPDEIQEQLAEIDNLHSQVLQAAKQKEESLEYAARIREEFNQRSEEIEDWIAEAKKLIEEENQGIDFGIVKNQMQKHQDFFDELPNYETKMEDLSQLGGNIANSLPADDKAAMIAQLQRLSSGLKEVSTASAECEEMLEKGIGDWETFKDRVEELEKKVNVLEKKDKMATPSTIDIAKENQLLNQNIAKDLQTLQPEFVSLEEEAMNLDNKANDQGKKTVALQIKPLEEGILDLRQHLKKEELQLQDMLQKWNDYHESMQAVEAVIADANQFIPDNLSHDAPYDALLQHLDNATLANEKLFTGEPKLVHHKNATDDLIDQIKSAKSSHPIKDDFQKLQETYHRLQKSASEKQAIISIELEERSNVMEMLSEIEEGLCEYNVTASTFNDSIGPALDDVDNKLEHSREIQEGISKKSAELDRIESGQERKYVAYHSDPPAEIIAEICRLRCLVNDVSQQLQENEEELDSANELRRSFHDQIEQLEDQMNATAERMQEPIEAVPDGILSQEDIHHEILGLSPALEAVQNQAQQITEQTENCEEKEQVIAVVNSIQQKLSELQHDSSKKGERLSEAVEIWEAYQDALHSVEDWIQKSQPIIATDLDLDNPDDVANQLHVHKDVVAISPRIHENLETMNTAAGKLATVCNTAPLVEKAVEMNEVATELESSATQRLQALERLANDWQDYQQRAQKLEKELQELKEILMDPESNEKNLNEQLELTQDVVADLNELKETLQELQKRKQQLIGSHHPTHTDPKLANLEEELDKIEEITQDNQDLLEQSIHQQDSFVAHLEKLSRKMLEAQEMVVSTPITADDIPGLEHQLSQHDALSSELQTFEIGIKDINTKKIELQEQANRLQEARKKAKEKLDSTSTPVSYEKPVEASEVKDTVERPKEKLEYTLCLASKPRLPFEDLKEEGNVCLEAVARELTKPSSKKHKRKLTEEDVPESGLGSSAEFPEEYSPTTKWTTESFPDRMSGFSSIKTLPELVLRSRNRNLADCVSEDEIDGKVSGESDAASLPSFASGISSPAFYTPDNGSPLHSQDENDEDDGTPVGASPDLSALGMFQRILQIKEKSPKTEETDGSLEIVIPEEESHIWKPLIEAPSPLVEVSDVYPIAQEERSLSFEDELIDEMEVPKQNVEIKPLKLNLPDAPTPPPSPVGEHRPSVSFSDDDIAILENYLQPPEKISLSDMQQELAKLEVDPSLILSSTGIDARSSFPIIDESIDRSCVSPVETPLQELLDKGNNLPAEKLFPEKRGPVHHVKFHTPLVQGELEEDNIPELDLSEKPAVDGTSHLYAPSFLESYPMSQAVSPVRQPFRNQAPPRGSTWQSSTSPRSSHEPEASLAVLSPQSRVAIGSAVSPIKPVTLPSGLHLDDEPKPRMLSFTDVDDDKKVEDLNKSWIHLQNKMQEKQNQLREALKRQVAYQDALSQVSIDMETAESTIEEIEQLSELPQKIEHVKVLLDELDDIKNAIEAVHDKGERILLPGDVNSREAMLASLDLLQEKVGRLKQNAKDLCYDAEAKHKEHEENISKLEACQEELQFIHDWTSELTLTLEVENEDEEEEELEPDIAGIQEEIIKNQNRLLEVSRKLQKLDDIQSFLEDTLAVEEIPLGYELLDREAEQREQLEKLKQELSDKQGNLCANRDAERLVQEYKVMQDWIEKNQAASSFLLSPEEACFNVEMLQQQAQLQQKLEEELSAHQTLVKSIARKGQRRSRRTASTTSNDGDSDQDVNELKARWEEISAHLGDKKRQLQTSLEYGRPQEFMPTSSYRQPRRSLTYNDEDDATSTEELKASLGHLNQCWEKLQMQVDDKQTQLEQAFEFQGHYQEALETVSSWLDNVQVKLFASDKGKDAQTQLEENTTLQNELQSFQEQLKVMNDACEMIVAEADVRDKNLIKQALSDLNERLTTLEKEAQQKEQDLVEKNKQFQEYQDEVQNFQTWLNETREMLEDESGDDQPDGTLGDVEQRLIQNQQRRQQFQKLEEDLVEYETNFRDLMDRGQQLQITNPQASVAMDIAGLKTNWEELQRQTSNRKNQLQRKKMFQEQYHKIIEDYSEYLATAEEKLRKDEVIATDLADLKDQLEKHKEFFGDAETHHVLIESIARKADPYTRSLFASKQAFLDKSTNQLQACGTVRGQNLEKIVTEWSQFEKNFDELKGWLGHVELQLPRSVSHDNMENVQKGIHKYQAMKNILGERQAAMQQVLEQGQALLNNITCAPLEKKLGNFSDRWNALQNKIDQDLKKLNTLLEEWRAFERESQEFLPWLDRSLNQLNDWSVKANQVEDLNTLAVLVDRFTEFRKDVENHVPMKVSVCSHGTQLLRIKELKLLKIREKLSKIEQQWTSLQNTVPIVQDQLHHLQMEMLPSRQALNELILWMEALEKQLKKDVGNIFTKSDEVETQFKRYMGYKIVLSAKQLTVDFVNQSVLQISQDLDQKRGDKTDFAEKLGSMNKRWQILNAKIADEVKTLEDLCSDWKEYEAAVLEMITWLDQSDAKIRKYDNRCGNEMSVQQAVRDCEVMSALLEKKEKDIEKVREMGLKVADETAVNQTMMTIQQSKISLLNLLSRLQVVLRGVKEQWNLYSESLQTVTQCLGEAEYSAGRVRTVGGTLGSFRLQVYKLKELQKEFKNNRIHLNRLTKQANQLTPALEKTVAESIERTVDDVSRRWKTIDEKIRDTLKQFERSLVMWQQFEERYSDVKDWVVEKERHCNNLLDNNNETEDQTDSGNDLKQCEILLTELQNYQDLNELKTFILNLTKEMDTPTATNVIGRRRMLEQKMETMKQSLSRHVATLQDDIDAQQKFHTKAEMLLERLADQEQVISRQDPNRSSDENSIRDRMDNLKSVMHDFTSHQAQLDALNDQGYKLSLNQSNASSLVHINNQWNKLSVKASEKYRNMQAVLLQQQSFAQKCDTWMIFLSQTEKNLAVDIAGNYEDLLKQQKVYAHFEADIFNRQQILFSIVNDGLRMIQDGEIDDPNEFQHKLTLLSEQWQNVVKRASQRKDIIDRNINDWHRYQELLEKMNEWFMEIEVEINQLEFETASIETLQSFLEAAKITQKAVSLNESKYLALNDAGKLLLRNTDRGASSMIRQRLADSQAHWHKVTTTLKRNLQRLEELITAWETSNQSIEDINKWLKTIRVMSAQPLPVMFDDMQKILQKCKEYEDCFKNSRHKLDRLNNQERNLANILSPDDISVLHERLLLLSKQWDEIHHQTCQKKQRIIERLNQWTNFGLRYKEICDWLSQMEAKVSQNGEHSIEDLLYNLQEGFKDEIAAAGNNKDQLIDLGERLMKASNELKSNDIEYKLAKLNDRWHHLMELIIARVKKLQETLTAVQQLDSNMANLKQWLSYIEKELACPVNYESCGNEEIQEKLLHQMEIQKDIEKHSTGVGSVLSLCEMLLHDCDACSTDADCEAIQAATRSLDQRWRNICTLSMEKKMRIEETWRLWQKFMEDYKRFEEWLVKTEKAVSYPDTAATQFSAIRDEIKKFEGFQRKIHENLAQLEIINKQYRRLAREGRTDSTDQLKTRVHDANNRWDSLARRCSSILRRLKYMQSEREEYENTREGLLVWLTEIDLQLTNVEHFSESDTSIKVKQIKAFQHEIDLNQSRIDDINSSAQILMQRCDPNDAVIIQESLDELHRYCEEVFSRVDRFQRKLQRISMAQGTYCELLTFSSLTLPIGGLIDNDGAESSEYETGESRESSPDRHSHHSNQSQESITRSLRSSHRDSSMEMLSARTSPFPSLRSSRASSSENELNKMISPTTEQKPVCRSHSPSREHRSGRDTPGSMASMDWDMYVTCNASQLEGIEPGGEKWKARQQDMDISQLKRALKECTQKMEEMDELLSVPTPSGPEIETEKEQFDVLVMDCKACVSTVKRRGNRVQDNPQLNQQVKAILNRWEDMQAKVLDKEAYLAQIYQQWQQFKNDLNNLNGWLDEAEIIIANQSQSGDVEDLEDTIKKYRMFTNLFDCIRERFDNESEFILGLNSRKAIAMSINLCSQQFTQSDSPEANDLKDQLTYMNRRWERMCSHATDWQKELQVAVTQCEEFHQTTDDLLVWLRQCEEYELENEPIDLMANILVLQKQYRVFLKLKQELDDTHPRVMTLKETADQLLIDVDSQECLETREKLQVIATSINHLRKTCHDNLELLETVIDPTDFDINQSPHLSRSGSTSSYIPDGIDSIEGIASETEHILSSTPRQDIPAVDDDDDDLDGISIIATGSIPSMEQPSSSDRPAKRPAFFGRVFRAALPLHLLMILLLGVACLVPMTEEDFSCMFMNNFARSLQPMLTYTNGPPPT